MIFLPILERVSKVLKGQIEVALSKRKEIKVSPPEVSIQRH
jgi:hypothetical protein